MQMRVKSQIILYPNLTADATVRLTLSQVFQSENCWKEVHAHAQYMQNLHVGDRDEEM